MNTYRDEYTLPGNSVDISDWVESRMLTRTMRAINANIRSNYIVGSEEKLNGLAWLKKTAKI